MKLRVTVLLFVGMFSAAPAFATGDCEKSVSTNVVQISSFPKFKRRNLSTLADSEVREKASKWQDELEALHYQGAKEFFNSDNAGYRIANQISAYAKSLIVEGQNKKLEGLIRSIDVPVNSYELPTYEPTFLGEFLIEAAIRANNPGAIITLNKLHSENLIAEPQIRRWTLDLVKAAQRNPQLSRLAPKIKHQIGSSFRAGLFQNTLLLDNEKLEAIQILQADPTAERLGLVLKQLLPSYSMSLVQNEEGDNIDLRVSANADDNTFKYVSYNIQDPQYFHKGALLRYYTKMARFDVIEDSRANEVVSLKFENNVLDVTVKRQEANQNFFAPKLSKLPKYQRLVLRYDESMRLHSLTISNGSLALTKWRWFSQAVHFPDEFVIQTGHAYFYPYASEVYERVSR